MTKDELSQLYWLAKLIENQKRRLEELRCLAEGSTPELSWIPHVPGITDRVGKFGVMIADLTTSLEGTLFRWWDAAESLRDYLESIDDPLVHEIMMLRYVEHLHWYEVAEAVGGGNTPDTVRMIHNRYLRA
jgi:hypothetical protein